MRLKNKNVQAYFLDSKGKLLGTHTHTVAFNQKEDWIALSSDDTYFDSILYNPFNNITIKLPNKINNLNIRYCNWDSMFNMTIENRKTELKGIMNLNTNNIIVPIENKFVYHNFSHENIFIGISDVNQISFYNNNSECIKKYSIDKNYKIIDLRTNSNICIAGNEKYHLFNIKTGTFFKHQPFFQYGEESENKRHVKFNHNDEWIVNQYGEKLFKLPFQDQDEDTTIFCEFLFSKFQNNRMAIGFYNEKKSFRSYLINENGDVVIPPHKYANIYQVSDDRLLLGRNQIFALADIDGNLLTDFCYKWDCYAPTMHQFVNGTLILEKKIGTKKRIMGGIDKNGNEVIPFIYNFERHILAEGNFFMYLDE